MKLHFPRDSMRECSVGRLLLWGVRREEKKNSALDITQHNNGTAAHYFPAACGSRAAFHRAEWPQPLDGAAWRRQWQQWRLHASRWGSFEPHGAQRSHSLLEKILNWWERRTIFRRRRTAHQEELNNTLSEAVKLNRKPLLLLFFFLFLLFLLLLCYFSNFFSVTRS